MSTLAAKSEANSRVVLPAKGKNHIKPRRQTCRLDRMKSLCLFVPPTIPVVKNKIYSPASLPAALRFRKCTAGQTGRGTLAGPDSKPHWITGVRLPVGWAKQGALDECESNFRVGRRAGKQKKDLPEGRSEDFNFLMRLVWPSPLASALT